MTIVAGFNFDKGVLTDTLEKFISSCKQRELGNASINRCLASLKRAFNLAYRSTPRKVFSVPVFPHLKESAPRKGFVEQTQYETLARQCPELWLRTALAVGYSCGFRKGELLNLRARQVDTFCIDPRNPNGAPITCITLDPGSTKNDEPRNAYLFEPNVIQLLRACVKNKKPDDFVFTRDDGKPVLDFRGTWSQICCAASLGHMLCATCGKELEYGKKCETEGHAAEPRYVGLLFHDLRRSAVRNFERSGVPRTVAMEISGHKTEAVYRRYNITSEADKIQAARQIAQFHETQSQAVENGHSLGTIDRSGTPAQTEHLPV